MQEIERKFLVASESFKEEAFSKTHMVQGFLNTHPERTVRVRLHNNVGFLTVKGKSSKSGTTRFEWEKAISKNEAENLLLLCEKGIIDKIRYKIKHKAHVFEVDEFLGDNEGLIVAEVELASENEHFEKPDWLGEEVTGQVQYYNSQLSKHPYKNWNH
ncbi:CYTH domain-containing protein [Galbibacter sp. EGI 63066]|uniref:CYTH domain-containing protein n=1 Tax=Galbibacter sp. EGI 63066 TaxID=2993559 RepID=UPI0022493904|nr:CYTH domain-containing protein [Galbibacter sp. EGI 63066]MCX2681014.1 CYTH domain-containing protein [Galbibacter sp. EGI 63066]